MKILINLLVFDTLKTEKKVRCANSVLDAIRNTRKEKKEPMPKGYSKNSVHAYVRVL